ncbi:DUF2202 domain-containing protein [Demequina phytophila]|uniref:DUF2202 domain-containing protein n=1 Tax=Demequina phytophila TaxID=1638981 RepID=UPI000782F578|nr:DUF2202 domain-containing protein [Demequina phytophila]
MTTRTTRYALAAAAGAALIAAPVGAAWAGAAGDDGPQDGYARDTGGMMGGMMGGAWDHDEDDDARGHAGMMGDDRSGDRSDDGGCLGLEYLEDLEVDGDPTDADAATLARIAEEERMAHDLYVELADAWDLRVFAMVARAEDHHLDAVRHLLDAYGLDDPTADARDGVYADDDLQAMYDELLAQGTASVTGALDAGAFVEETDIADLRDQSADSDAAAALLDRLEEASEHHLAAFVRALDREGVAYEASVLDPAEVEDLTGVPAP